MARYQSLRVHHSVSPSAQAAFVPHLERRVLLKQLVVNVKLHAGGSRHSHRRVSRHLKNTSRRVESSSTARQAMPLLLTFETASRAFSASEVWHAGVILYDAYNAADTRCYIACNPTKQCLIVDLAIQVVFLSCHHLHFLHYRSEAAGAWGFNSLITACVKGSGFL